MRLFGGVGTDMNSLNEGYCLVLSGGGAKGVYHIGVWRALKELGIEVDAFVGTSIGAIIAGFLAQGADEALEEIGRSITVDSILALPGEIAENGKVKVDRKSFSAAREFFASLLEKKGLDTSPMRRILTSLLDEKAIRKSGKDLGIVTVNLSDLEPRELFVEDMEEGKLVDYLMASAAFPGFAPPEIAGKKYVDGGLYDNIPYEMARRRGHRRLIVSDISGAGRNRKPDIEGSVTAYVRNSIDMGGALDFDRRFLDGFTLLGYLDAMRTFGRFKGYSYFLEPDARAEAAFAAAEAGRASPEFPETMRHDRDLLLKYLECAAAILEVERLRAYGYDELAASVAEKKSAADSRVADCLGQARKGKTGIVAMLRESIAKRTFDGSPYYYWRLVEEFLPQNSVIRKALIGHFPELPAGLAYLGRG
jgi:NTE family protein